jgi:hypothetical protein
MPIESATYISDLVATNPVGATDTKATLDDHIRLVKSTVQATFPNITGAVTPTHTELNYVDGVTSAIQTQINAKAPTASPTFTGVPAAPTAAVGTATTQLATCEFVDNTAFAVASGLTAASQAEMEAGTEAALRTMSPLRVAQAIDAQVVLPVPGLVLIDTKTASASASLDFTTGINSTYEEYVLELVNVVVGTAGQNLHFRTSTDGGANFDAGASDYFYAGNSWTSAGVSTVISSAGASQILMANNVTGTASHGGVSGSIRFYNPAGAVAFKQFIFDLINSRSATTVDMIRLAASRAAAADIDAVRLIANSGTVLSGTVRLYGVRKT